MILSDKLASIMQANGCEELTIVLNGEFVLFHEKMVYVHLCYLAEQPYIEFYTKTKNSATGKSASPNMITVLENQLTSKDLYDLHVDIELSLEECNFEVCSELNLLILESALYHTAHLIVNDEKKYSRMRVGSTIINEKQITALEDVFKANSFAVYQKLVYAAGNNRFLNKLMKCNKFFGIQKSFIPVFVNFSQVYNPFSDTSLHMEDTKLFKLAIEKNRFVTFGDKLSCYFLTHEEICRAFGMIHFMRFTPDFCYSLFVGLLKPSLSSFPNKLTKVFMGAKGYVASYNLKTRYTPTQFLEKVVEIKEKLKTENTEENNEILQALQSYSEVDSLYFYCAEAYSRLTNIGATVLDDKENTTLAKIYEFASEAKLIYE